MRRNVRPIGGQADNYCGVFPRQPDDNCIRCGRESDQCGPADCRQNSRFGTYGAPQALNYQGFSPRGMGTQRTLRVGFDDRFGVMLQLYGHLRVAGGRNSSGGKRLEWFGKLNRDG
jgi:hypothetical protein